MRPIKFSDTLRYKRITQSRPDQVIIHKKKIIFHLEDFIIPTNHRVCFVLRHINLIGHLMLNRVKESKSEKKFKGEVLGINDKL